MTQRLLLVVEGCSSTPDIGLMLMPNLRLGTSPDPQSARVVLKRADGTSLTAAIRFGQAHLSLRPDAWKADIEPWRDVCALQGVGEADVPPGTEVWYDDAPETQKAQG